MTDFEAEARAWLQTDVDPGTHTVTFASADGHEGCFTAEEMVVKLAAFARHYAAEELLRAAEMFDSIAEEHRREQPSAWEEAGAVKYCAVSLRARADELEGGEDG